MNVLERTLVKLAWKRAEGKMGDKFKRYLPLVGSVVLVAVVALRWLGYGDAAAAIESVGGAVGVTNQSEVGVGELTAAAATLAGLVLKFKSMYDKAHG